MTGRPPTLKSTYKPSPTLQAPLQPGWTEHKAPSGHTYYHNAATKESTYKRPAVAVEATPAAGGAGPASFPQQLLPHGIPNLSNPVVANAFLAQHNRPPGGGRAPERREARPRPQPNDGPRSKQAIPGCEPWVLVNTKYGRRFVFNPEKGTSYWRIPEKVMKGVLELDRARVAAKMRGEDAGVKAGSDGVEGAGDARTKAKAGDGGGGDTLGKEMSVAPAPKAAAVEEEHDDSSEYEEVEVTDNEDDDEAEAGQDDGAEDEDGHRSKRQRTEDPDEEMALQLELMAQEQALQQGDHYDEDGGEGEGEEGELPGFSDEDARDLFRDLLDDYKINPFSPWDTLIEQGKIVEDPRYTVLPTTRARREVWEAWSREGIRRSKEARAREERPDPRVAYMTFLGEKASPKLYWPEFKRKFRREACMRDLDVSDRDRERWYREYMARLKMPLAAQRADLTALLRGLPLATLNAGSGAGALPAEVLADVRYVALPPEVRDPLVEAYVQTLGPAPGAAEAEAGAGAERAREARRRRERALEERNRAVEERKEREGRSKEAARARLREGEMEIRRAMEVGKRGAGGG